MNTSAFVNNSMMEQHSQMPYHIRQQAYQLPKKQVRDRSLKKKKVKKVGNET